MNVGIHDGRLWTFVGPSAKLRDLRDDGRHALHAFVDPTRPVEVVVRGKAAPVDDATLRAAVATSDR